MPTIAVRWSDNTKDLKTNLKEGVNQIEATRTSVAKLVQALAGDNLVAAAHKWTVAISEMGGIAKISAGDQVKAFTLVSKAIETLERQAKPVPDALRAIQAELKAATAPASALNSYIGDLSKNIVATATGFISAQAVLGGVSTGWRALTGLVSESVKAYATAEAAQVKLTAALRTQGQATPEVISQYNDLATEFQRTTVFSDDLINHMEALLVEVGGVMPGQMKAALQASTDLAAGLGVDLEAATTLVAKAAAGHTETLARYGITVDSVRAKTDSLGAVLEGINRQFGGQASAQLDTYAGKLQQAANAWDNVKEAIGKSIVTDPAIEAALRHLADGANEADKEASGLHVTLGGVAEVLAFIAAPPMALFTIPLIEGLERSSKKANDLIDTLHRLRTAGVVTAPSHEVPTQPGRGPGFIEGQSLPDNFFDELEVRRQQAIEKARKALEDYRETVKSTELVYQGFGRVVMTIDGTIVELVRDELAHGVSMADLAIKYGLTKDQAKALDDQIKFEQAVVEATTKDFHGLAAVIPEVSSNGAALANILQGLTEDGLLPADNTVRNLRGHLLNLKDIGQGASVDLSKVGDGAIHAKDGVAELAQALAQLAQVSGGSLSSVARDIGEVVNGLDVAKKSVSAFKSPNDGLLDKLSAGLSIASLGIQIGTMLYHVFHKTEAQKLMADVGRDWGMQISDGLSKQMEADSKKFGRQAAELLHAKEIFSENGGITVDNVDAATRHLRDVFSLIQIGQLSIAQGAKVIDDNWSDLVAAGTDDFGFLSDQLKELIALDDQFGTHSKAIADYRKAQSSSATTGVNAAIGGLSADLAYWQQLKTSIDDATKAGDAWMQDAAEIAKGRRSLADMQAEQAGVAKNVKGQLEDLGIVAVGTFGAAIASGKSFNEAMTEAAPGLQQLADAFHNLGISTDNAGLSVLMLQSQILKENPELVQAVGGLGSALVGLSNMGMLNVDTFEAMERSGMTMYVKLQAAVAAHGGSTRDALLPMQDYLHKAEQAAKDLGVPLDDNTQMLINQSKELGIWQDTGETAAEKQEKGIDSLTEAIKHLTNALLGIPDVDFDVNQHNHVTGPTYEDFVRDYWAPDRDEVLAKMKPAGETSAPPNGTPGNGPNRDTGESGPIYAAEGWIGELASPDSLFVPHGADTIPAMIGADEMVLTASQQHAVGALTARALDNPGRGGDLTVQVVIDGQVVGETIVRKFAQDKRGLGTKARRALGLTTGGGS